MPSRNGLSTSTTPGWGCCAARRHQRLQAEIGKFFDRQRRSDDRPDSDPNGFGLLFWEMLDKTVREGSADGSLARNIGAELCWSLWNGHEIAGHEILEPADVPPDVALTSALNVMADPFADARSMAMTALVAADVARLPAEAFYYPKEFLPYARVKYEPAVVVDYLRRTELRATPQVPATRPDRPGRNAPCPCGSGAKYKRCCGA